MNRRIDRIADEAATWFTRAREADFSRDEREELAAWLAASAEHVREYLSCSTIAHDLANTFEIDDVENLVALAREAASDTNVIAFRDTDTDAPANQSRLRPARIRTRTWLGLLATAVGIAMTAILAYIPLKTPDPNRYATGTGEQRSFRLEDGSLVILNAQSTLKVRYEDRYREIRLLTGEAMFDVVKDPARPFYVITEQAIIHAIGTQFNVRHRGAGTSVTVVEGVVEVQPTPEIQFGPGAEFSGVRGAYYGSSGQNAAVPTARLDVGQQARIDGDEVLVSTVDVQKAVSWRERNIVFDAQALQNVVAEFNLFNEQKIVVRDPDLAERAISGAFNADDRKSFTLFLQEVGLASPERQADGTIVLRAPKRE